MTRKSPVAPRPARHADAVKGKRWPARFLFLAGGWPQEGQPWPVWSGAGSSRTMPGLWRPDTPLIGGLPEMEICQNMGNAIKNTRQPYPCCLHIPVGGTTAPCGRNDGVRPRSAQRADARRGGGIRLRVAVLARFSGTLWHASPGAEGANSNVKREFSPKAADSSASSRNGRLLHPASPTSTHSNARVNHTL
eukprot:gene13121-biopygen9540